MYGIPCGLRKLTIASATWLTIVVSTGLVPGGVAK